MRRCASSCWPGSYRPGPYVHFQHRRAQAAHHQRCTLPRSGGTSCPVQPDRAIVRGAFIGDSFANRPGKGTHRAIDRCRRWPGRTNMCCAWTSSSTFRPSTTRFSSRTSRGFRLRTSCPTLIGKIIASGAGILDQEYQPPFFPGDDLLAACRPRGLPIGNLTSQFWSNCYLHPLDLFVKRELGVNPTCAMWTTSLCSATASDSS